MERLINLMKAMGEENRFRIVMMLRVRPLCVCEIREVLGISLSTVSIHLKQLAHAGIVKGEKDGRWVIYKLTDSKFIRDIVERISVEGSRSKQLRMDRERVETVSPEICSLKLKNRDVRRDFSDDS